MPLTQLAYTKGYVGLLSFQYTYKLSDWYTWATGLPYATVERAYNLTALQKFRSFDSALNRVLNAYQFNGLSGNQPYYMTLRYVGPSSLQQKFDNTLIIADYLKGVKYMETKVEMEHILKINGNAPKSSILGKSLQVISNEYHETTADQFKTIHGLTDAQLVEVQNKNVSEIEKIGIYAEYATIETLIKFRISTG